MNTNDQLKHVLMLYSSDIWKDRHAGPHTNQQEQQFSDFSTGCAASFQVRECFFSVAHRTVAHGASNFMDSSSWI